MGIRDRIRTRYSTGGRKQMAYDLMKLLSVAALGWGANDWNNRGKRIHELEVKELDLEGKLTNLENFYNDLHPEDKELSKRFKKQFGRRRRRSTRRKSRKSRKSCRRSKKCKSFGRRRRSRKGSKKSKKSRKSRRKSFGRRRRSRKGSKKSRKSRRKSRKH